jgi:hypothetical protein
MISDLFVVMCSTCNTGQGNKRLPPKKNQEKSVHTIIIYKVIHTGMLICFLTLLLKVLSARRTQKSKKEEMGPDRDSTLRMLDI